MTPEKWNRWLFGELKAIENGKIAEYKRTNNNGEFGFAK